VALESLAEFRNDLRTRYERELLLVALGVAKKVVQQELAEHPEIWLTMIRSAVKQAVDRERILVRVPPDLAQYLLSEAPNLRAALDEVKELQIVDDPRLPPLGCIIESRYGEVDIGVETQLGVAERALVGAED
jgi:flagellar biosynthesis/type III secretory pathway protein FliH